MISVRQCMIASAVIAAAPLWNNPASSATRTFRNDNYLFQITAPAGRRVCIAASGSNAQGLGYNISAPWDCRLNTKKSTISVVGIYANFNTSFKTLRDAIGPCKSPRGIVRPDISRRLKFRDRPTVQCIRPGKDGSFDLTLYTQGSRWSHQHTACIIYDVYLHTSRSRLDRDIVEFEKFLRGIKIGFDVC